jgi:hypothetical protein
MKTISDKKQGFFPATPAKRRFRKLHRLDPVWEGRSRMAHGRGTQQSGFAGPTTEQWQVSLGSDTPDSTLMNTPGGQFAPWNQQVMTFTATSTSEVLSRHPVSLLDDAASDRSGIWPTASAPRRGAVPPSRHQFGEGLSM